MSVRMVHTPRASLYWNSLHLDEMKIALFRIYALVLISCLPQAAILSQPYSLEIANSTEVATWGSAFGGITIDDNGSVFLNIESIDPFLFPSIVSNIRGTSTTRISTAGVVEFQTSLNESSILVARGNPLIFGQNLLVLQNDYIGTSCALPNVRVPRIQVYDKLSGEAIDEFILENAIINGQVTCYNDVFFYKSLEVLNGHLYVLTEVDYDNGLDEQYGDTLDYCEFEGNVNRINEIRKYDLNDFSYEIISAYQVDKHHSTPVELISDNNFFPFLTNVQYNSEDGVFESFFGWLNSIKRLSIDGELIDSIALDFDCPIEVDENGMVLNVQDLWSPFHRTGCISNELTHVLFSSTLFNETRLYALDKSGSLIKAVILDDYYNSYQYIGDEIWIYSGGRYSDEALEIRRFDKDLNPLTSITTEVGGIVLEGISSSDNYYLLYGTKYLVHPNEAVFDIDNPPVDPYTKAFIYKRLVPIESSLLEGLVRIDITPNPVREYLNIDTELAFSSFQVIDISGKVVLSSAGKTDTPINSRTIDFQLFKPGLYFIAINLRDNRRVVKSIVKH